jgi:hypothetical protein
MQSVESALKVEILNAIRAVESAKTRDEARKVGERYGSAVRRVHAAHYEISAISFGDKREPVDVRLKHVPARAGARQVCAV